MCVVWVRAMCFGEKIWDSAGWSQPFVDKSWAVEFWEKICDVLVWNGEDCGVT